MKCCRYILGSNEVTTLITRFYANVLHRTPDQAGYDYWLGQLNAKVSTPASALASFSESQENKAQTADAIKNGIAYITDFQVSRIAGVCIF
ncbi:DUF4214 domain-containing protein [Undibacterium umbellatum]|uniref:DUF4214 domain-containing protein n=1 Tax=Undibacterium umbellatum TaxID=2762300 RepID=UPI003BB5FF73